MSAEAEKKISVWFPPVLIQFKAAGLTSSFFISMPLMLYSYGCLQLH